MESSKKPYKSAIFDFDGTLIDSFAGIAECLQRTAIEFLGLEKPLEFFRPFSGPLIIDGFKQFFNLSDDKAMEAAMRFRDLYIEYGVNNYTVFDGIPELLQSLKESGIKTAIVSNKVVSDIEEILIREDLIRLFDVIKAVEFHGHRTTKAENIEKVLSHFGFSKADAVMVGDRYFDAEGAEVAGIDFVAALYGGCGPREEFNRYPCVYFAKNAADIKSFLLG